jgi:potassium-dependent mechanosensitive channel
MRFPKIRASFIHRNAKSGFERSWCALIAAVVIVLMSVTGFGNQSQPAYAAADQAVSQDQQQTTGLDDKHVAEFTAALERWRKELNLVQEIVSSERASDEDLRDAPDRLEALRRDIVARMDQLRPELKEAQARLQELGPAPDESGPGESPETTAQRRKLDADVAALDGAMKQANVLLVRTDQLINDANTKRRERFTESLFRPVPGLFQNVLPAAVEGTAFQAEALLKALGEWLRTALDKGPLLVILLVLAPLAGAVIAKRFVRRITVMRARSARRTTAELTSQRRGTIAILKALESALPVWTALAAFYLIATAAELAEPGPLGLLGGACIAIGWARLLFAVVSHSLIPSDPAARLVAIDDESAWNLGVLLWASVAVWLIDQFWGLAEAVVFTPEQQQVLHAFVIASLYVGLLAILLWQLRRGALSRQAPNSWLGWAFSVCALLAAVLVISVLLGYTELARFLGSNAVTTAGLLWILYLLHLGAESISSVSVVSGRQIEGETPEEEADAPSLLTIRIIAGLLMDIVIVAVGVTILLVLWRFDWVEVKGWIQAVFFGFQFGELRISLQTILIALAVFALGLALTRFVQRWFVKRAFAGRKRDQGLQESIKLGLGYVGFVLAALAGLSYLGLDFSNLAIVAGALSVGIGFGLQSIFNNFVSGLILLVERPIKIGDWIAVGGYEGMVKKISVRSTEIETIYRQSVIIPNANLITESVINWMHGNRTCRLDIPVGVSYDTDVKILRKVLLEVGAAHGATLKTPAPVVHFAGFGDSSLDFELRVFLRDAAQRITVASDLRFAIWSALQEAGIVIPFPQRDLHIKAGAAKIET